MGSPHDVHARSSVCKEWLIEVIFMRSKCCIFNLKIFFMTIFPYNNSLRKRDVICGSSYIIKEVPVNYILWPVLSRKFIRQKLYVVIVSIAKHLYYYYLGVRFPWSTEWFLSVKHNQSIRGIFSNLSLENLLQFCSYQKCNPILISVCLWCGNKNQTSL